MRRDFPRSLVILSLFFSSALYAEPSTAFTPIDLTSATWYAREGFVDVAELGDLADTAFEGDGADVDAKGFKQTHPPVMLLDFFKKASGEETYRFTVVIPVNLTAADLENPLLLQLGWIGEGWRLYVNQRLQADHLFLDQAGHLEKTRTFRGIRVPVDPSALHEGRNLFVFHIAGRAAPTDFATNDGVGFLISSPYLLTSPDQIEGQAGELLAVALNTVYFFFGLYHFLIFVKRRQDMYNFFFGLFSILLAVYGITVVSFLYPLFDDTGWIIRIKYAVQPLMLPLFLLFFHSYARSEEKPTPFMNVSLIVAGLLSAFFLFMPIRWMEQGLRLFYILAGVFLVTSIYYVFILWRSKAPGIRLLLLSVVLLIAATAFEIVDGLVFFTGIRLVQFGFFIFVMALVAMLANRFLNVHNESERLNFELTHQKNAFKRFVPVQFLELLGRSSATDIRLGDSSLLHMSVLMCDLRGFTSMSEKLSPDATLRFLNEYLDRMQPAIERQEGFVDKFVGDAILALFSDHNKPEQYREQYSTADRAVHAAIEMRRQLMLYNEKRDGNHEGLVDMGVGINTGPLVLGTVGSEQRLDTTVIGNTVNLASRIESLCRRYSAGILITVETLEALTVPGHYQIRELDLVRVKGKADPVRIFEVFDADLPEAREGRICIRSDFEAGLAAFRAGEFDEAVARFSACMHAYPADRATLLHLRRSQIYAKHPPAADWDGVFDMRYKKELSI